MKEWNRTTKKQSFAELPPEISTAINAHCELYNLGPILHEPLICIETFSKKNKWKPFGWGTPRQTMQTVILAPHWLVIGFQSDRQDSPGILSLPLKDAVVEDLAKEPLYQKMGEDGLHVTGVYTGRVSTHGSQRITSTLFFGEEAAAGEFKVLLFAAVKQAREEGSEAG